MIKTKLIQWLNWSKFIKLEICPQSNGIVTMVCINVKMMQKWGFGNLMMET